MLVCLLVGWVSWLACLLRACLLAEFGILNSNLSLPLSLLGHACFLGPAFREVVGARAHGGGKWVSDAKFARDACWDKTQIVPNQCLTMTSRSGADSRVVAHIVSRTHTVGTRWAGGVTTWRNGGGSGCTSRKSKSSNGWNSKDCSSYHRKLEFLERKGKDSRAWC